MKLNTIISFVPEKDGPPNGETGTKLTRYCVAAWTGQRRKANRPINPSWSISPGDDIAPLHRFVSPSPGEILHDEANRILYNTEVVFPYTSQDGLAQTYPSPRDPKAAKSLRLIKSIEQRFVFLFVPFYSLSADPRIK
ncbi:hypothetical protein CHS0354_004065 [Potamilus streckersoni]|uniref:Uncharacterized protein n=1 Tax=Potamilus streckersoni TaxID=2493646 RepID=A0AAE0T837_9BIVA|nr:hypothetical protein CHS0354_004065 [Potamilus streckersoni]